MRQSVRNLALICLSTTLGLGSIAVAAGPAQAAVSPSPAATYAVGAAPQGIAVNPAGTVAFVANSGETSISRINLATGAITSIPISGSPRDIVSDPSGTYAYVTSYVADATTGLVTRLTFSDSSTTSITVGADPTRIVVNPSGTYAYVNVAGENVDRITLGDLSVTSAFLTGSPGTISITPDGQTIFSMWNSDKSAKYAADGTFIKRVYTLVNDSGGSGFNADASNLYIVASDGTVRGRATDANIGFDWYGSTSTGAGSCDWLTVGNYAYIPASTAGTLSKVDLTNFDVTTVASGLASPQAVAAPSDGRFLLVTEQDSDTVVKIVPPSPMILSFSTALGGMDINLPLNNGTLSIDWGDGSTTSTTSHTYASGGTYTIKVSGTVTGFGDGDHTGYAGITSVSSYGSLPLDSLKFAFRGATNLTSVPAPPTTVREFWGMFQGATSFNGDVSTWDMSSADNLHDMFLNAISFNHKVSDWNTSNVYNMTGMFAGATAFNNGCVSGVYTCPLAPSGTSWDTAKVTSFEGMFSGATAFNQSVDGWNTSSATNMSSMFSHAYAFNNGCAQSSVTCPFSPSGNAWDTSKVRNFGAMFHGDESFTVKSTFNQKVTDLSLASATNLGYMFREADSFNNGCAPGVSTCPMASTATAWNSGSVTGFNHMFMGTDAFNQSVSGMDTHSATDMTRMFDGATAFNNGCAKGSAACPMTAVSGWNMAKVVESSEMLQNASSFDQDISTWDLRSMSVGYRMLQATALSPAHYNGLLVNLAGLPLKTGASFGAYPTTYYGAAAVAAHDKLTGDMGAGGFGWSISDGGVGVAPTQPSTIGSITPATGTYAAGTSLTFSSAVTQTTGGAACDTSGAYAPTYTLSADPTGNGTVPFTVAAGSVNTTGWAAGAYTLTVTYPGDGTCDASTNSTSVVTIVVPTAPSAPASVTGSRGEKKISVSWTAPTSDGNSSIVGYRVQVSRNGGEFADTKGGCAPQNTSVSTALTCTMTGLDNTSTYRVQVAALNGVGLGDWTVSTAITPLPVKKPKP